uniref:Ribonuclease A-domain domain-containing protein n=1 Tax=Oreochromis niloticus TaxID=8128 RepID=I3JK40_ORENI
MGVIMRILFICLLLVGKFGRQHIDASMKAKDCDKVMKSKQIYNLDSSCKDTNTFILDNPTEVKNICVEGKFDEKLQMTKSHKKFTVVKCVLKNEGTRKPRCQYDGNRLTNRYVAVACEDKLPVHFARDILVLDG